MLSVASDAGFCATTFNIYRSISNRYTHIVLQHMAFLTVKRSSLRNITGSSLEFYMWRFEAGAEVDIVTDIFGEDEPANSLHPSNGIFLSITTDLPIRSSTRWWPQYPDLLSEDSCLIQSHPRRRNDSIRYHGISPRLPVWLKKLRSWV